VLRSVTRTWAAGPPASTTTQPHRHARPHQLLAANYANDVVATVRSAAAPRHPLPPCGARAALRSPAIQAWLVFDVLVLPGPVAAVPPLMSEGERTDIVRNLARHPLGDRAGAEAAARPLQRGLERRDQVQADALSAFRLGYLTSERGAAERSTGPAANRSPASGRGRASAAIPMELRTCRRPLASTYYVSTFGFPLRPRRPWGD